MARKFQFALRPQQNLVAQAVGHVDALSVADLAEIEAHEASLLRSWLVKESLLQSGMLRGKVKWNAVWGLGLATLLSASVWTGIALLVSYIWK